MRSTFSVIFYLKKDKVKKDGTSPIMGRITVDGTQAQFSCKVSIEPNLWGIKGGRAVGKSVTARETNRMLDKLRAAITRHYQEIMERDSFVTAEKVRNAFLGLEYCRQTLIKAYDLFLEDYVKKVECGMKAKNTLYKYRAVYEHLKDFLQSRYNVHDIALKEILPTLITDFEAYLRADCRLSPNTVWLYTFPVRMLLHKAVENGWLTRYPFAGYEIHKEEIEKGFLTKEELGLLINASKMNFKRTLIRDLFLFCAFTGLAYIDLKNLREENIVSNPLDGVWIHTHRQKTGVETNVRLLDIPLQIMKKYKGLCDDGRVFPVPAYNSCKRILRTVMRICGISKHVTWHMAKHRKFRKYQLTNRLV